VKLTKCPQALADVVRAHAESLSIKVERALPCRTGKTTLVVGPYSREGLHQVGLANGSQHAGHHDVGGREIGAGDPVAPVEAALDAAEPAMGEFWYLGVELARCLAAVEDSEQIEARQGWLHGGDCSEAPLHDARAAVRIVG